MMHSGQNKPGHTAMSRLLGALLLLLVVGSVVLVPRPVAAQEADAETGRITGTVIAQTTGLPASRIAVQVGSDLVYTDRNGNYEWVPPAAGDYIVALALDPRQGTPLQEPQTVTYSPGASVVVHLFFVRPDTSDEPVRTLEKLPNERERPYEITPMREDQGGQALVGEVLVIVTPDDIDENIFLFTRPIAQHEAPEPNSGSDFESNLVQIEMAGSCGQMVEVPRFENPVEIRFLAPGEIDLDDGVFVQFFDPEANAWINLPTVVNDDGTISAFTLHLSLFALT